MERPARRAAGFAVLLVAAILISLPASAGGSCLQIRVGDSFVSPDGKIQGPGVVKICPHWTISPSLRLSRIYFNGRVLGVWMQHTGEGGAFDDRDRMVALRRLPEGKIALADYFWFGPDGRPSAPGLRAAQLARAGEGSAGDSAAQIPFHRN